MNLFRNYNSEFIGACQAGNLTIAQELYNIKYLYIFRCVNIHSQDEFAFRSTCEFGHLHVAQWLMSLKNPPNIHAWDEDAFRCACRRGYLGLAQWLYSFGNVDIHAANEDAFYSACTHGHLHVAQWLYYNLGGIDIHARNDFAFHWSCIMGHLHVAQWLYTLGNVDVHIPDNLAFWSVCQSGHLHVAQWLYSLGNIHIGNDVHHYLPLHIHTWLSALYKNMTLKENGDYLESITRENCGICLETQANRITPCHHQFCESCIKQWCNTKLTLQELPCPYCRQDISSGVFILSSTTEH